MRKKRARRECHGGTMRFSNTMSGTSVDFCWTERGELLINGGAVRLWVECNHLDSWGDDDAFVEARDFVWGNERFGLMQQLIECGCHVWPPEFWSVIGAQPPLAAYQTMEALLALLLLEHPLVGLFTSFQITYAYVGKPHSNVPPQDFHRVLSATLQ